MWAHVNVHWTPCISVSDRIRSHILHYYFEFVYPCGEDVITLTCLFYVLTPQKESEKRNVTVQADDPISFMQLTAKNETSSKEDQFQLSLLAAMGNTQRKEAADPLASKLNKVTHCDDAGYNIYTSINTT